MQTEQSLVVNILGHPIRIDEIVNPQLRRIIQSRMKAPSTGGKLGQQYPDSDYSEYNEYQGEHTEYAE